MLYCPTGRRAASPARCPVGPSPRPGSPQGPGSTARAEPRVELTGRRGVIDHVARRARSPLRRSPDRQRLTLWRSRSRCARLGARRGLPIALSAQLTALSYRVRRSLRMTMAGVLAPFDVAENDFAAELARDLRCARRSGLRAERGTGSDACQRRRHRRAGTDGTATNGSRDAARVLVEPRGADAHLNVGRTGREAAAGRSVASPASGT